MKELSKEDQQLLKFGPQPYLPDQVLRYKELVEMLKKDDKEKKFA
tara:strand:+ start:426 stop:560 length:135 start_codon:yes stop_codon:yes gene_type:complete